jgi:hypothetical protein
MGREWNPKGADAVLVLTSIDPTFGSEQLAHWAGRAVVIIDPRKVSSGRVTATAELLRHARMAIRSAILIGVPPEDDDTAGVAGARHSNDGDQRPHGVLQSTRR